MTSGRATPAKRPRRCSVCVERTDEPSGDMWVTPHVVAAGQLFDVHFPPGVMRGLSLTLSQLGADGGQPSHLLTSDALGGGVKPRWWPWDEAVDLFIEAVGIVWQWAIRQR
jgi:hypothetical protein